jgi:hypothetical protein
LDRYDRGRKGSIGQVQTYRNTTSATLSISVGARRVNESAELSTLWVDENESKGSR